MPFTSYLVSKFDHSHENEFFKDLSNNLKIKFGESKDDHVLLGNIGVSGNELDAIFIKNGQITIIDFKNYGGELTVGENSAWVIKPSNDKEVFVAGGGRERNPFHQVRKYRRALIDFLSDHSDRILSKNHENLNWGHLGGMIVFHKKISTIKNKDFGKDDKWFHISDYSSVVDSLDNLYSKNLNLNNSEIESILKVLGIDDSMVLANHVWEPKQKENAKSQKDGVNLQLIRKLVDPKTTETKFQKALEFYKTMLKVEQLKDPEIPDFYKFPFEPNQPLEKYRLNIKASDKFYDAYVKNFAQNFPKNLLVILTLNIDGKSIPLLYETFLANDVKSKEDLVLNLNQFELFRKSLEKMGLGEDLLDELATAVNSQNTLDEKINTLREFLGAAIELTKGIEVGLSSEGLFTAQVIAELNKLKSIGEKDVENTVFKSILMDLDLDLSAHPQLPLKPFIQVTRLNESQSEAVKKSFENPLTVITGPPGTGKSQVVLNILANAVANGYSVVFSSKNNSAIDCVKERFDELTNQEYLLRLGSKDYIFERFKPKIEKFLTEFEHSHIESDPSELGVLAKKIEPSQIRLESLQRKLKLINEIPIEIERLTAELKSVQDEFSRWKTEQDPKWYELFIELGLKTKIDINELNGLINELKGWDSGWFSKMVFNLFKKGGFESRVKLLNQSQSEILYDLVSKEDSWVQLDKPFLSSCRSNLEKWSSLKSISEAMRERFENFKISLENLEKEKNRLSEELRQLISEEKEIRDEIDQLEKELISLGSRFLNLSISTKTNFEDLYSIRKFSDYLPANQLYKSEDLESFKRETDQFLKNFNVLAMTNLSVKNSLPLSKGIVDMVVIDEASQSDIATALPLIYRAKKVVIIGDPLQLRHITSVNKHEQAYAVDSLGLVDIQPDYSNSSLYDIGHKTSLKLKIHSVFLNDHYRCHPEIIDFSNREFYIAKLGQSLIIKTSIKERNFGDPGLTWIHVKGEMEGKLNVNQAEINRCLKLAKDLKIKYPKASIGVITPFKDQKNRLQTAFFQEFQTSIIADTVHRFQGDERDIIILSLVATDDAPDSKANFINNNPELINVAVSRAKSALYIVGNHSYCKNTMERDKQAPLSLLARYAESIKKVKN
ncbi:MAG: AAA family ATPase [Cytophagia bacterium]|nr:AAA family ATPase [Cytophagia bacterium]